MEKKYFLFLIATMIASAGAHAQGLVLSLDSCLSMALRNNNQLKAAQMHVEVEKNLRKATRTKYYPSVSATAGYTWMSREVSILSDEEKSKLNNLGTNAAGKVSSVVAPILKGLEDSKIDPDFLSLLTQRFTTGMGELSRIGNTLGAGVADRFRTDTRNVWAGALLMTQPVYMGGALTAVNNIADIKERIAGHALGFVTRQTEYEVEESYWLVVSLKHKLLLAENMYSLVSKLDSDVKKMIQEGVATRADGLHIAVRKNESEMILSQVQDGLSLAKMLLCQRCGLPLDTDITLADENTDALAVTCDMIDESFDSFGGRPEIKLAEDAVKISEQGVKLARSLHLPKVALTAGYLLSNPNMYDGFRKRFGGVFTAGVVVNVPLTGWIEGTYRVRSAKAANAVAKYGQAEINEKLELEASQCRFKAKEARKRLEMAEKNISSADENLRCANIGFKEGVMGSTEILAAQTAWFQAQSQKIDAQIEVKMTNLALRKALGHAL